MEAWPSISKTHAATNTKSLKQERWSFISKPFSTSGLQWSAPDRNAQNLVAAEVVPKIKINLDLLEKNKQKNDEDEVKHSLKVIHEQEMYAEVFQIENRQYCNQMNEIPRRQ